MRGWSLSHSSGGDDMIRARDSTRRRAFQDCEPQLLKENVDSESVSSDGTDSLDSERNDRSSSLGELDI